MWVAGVAPLSASVAEHAGCLQLCCDPASLASSRALAPWLRLNLEAARVQRAGNARPDGVPAACNCRQARRSCVSEPKPETAAAWVTLWPECSAACATASRIRRRYCSGAMPAWSTNRRLRWRGEVQARELMRAQRKHPQNMTAYDLMLQGIDQMFRVNSASAAQARGLLQQAMVLDPYYAAAYSYAAYWHVFRVGEGWSTDPIADAREALRLAGVAINLNPDDPQALAVYGHVQSFLRHEFDKAMIYLDRAIEAGPSSALAYTMSSATCGYLGQTDLGVERGRQGLRLSPIDAHRFWHEGVLAQAACWLRTASTCRSSRIMKSSRPGWAGRWQAHRRCARRSGRRISRTPK